MTEFGDKLRGAFASVAESKAARQESERQEAEENDRIIRDAKQRRDQLEGVVQRIRANLIRPIIGEIQKELIGGILEEKDSYWRYQIGRDVII